MPSVSSLLVIDGLINLALGLLLLAFPRPVVAALGVPAPQLSFYARILGGILFGIGVALLLEPSRGDGLGLGGAIAINLSGAAALAGCLAFQRLEIPRRGRVLLWLIALGLVAISAAELRAIGTL